VADATLGAGTNRTRDQRIVDRLIPMLVVGDQVEEAGEIARLIYRHLREAYDFTFITRSNKDGSSRISSCVSSSSLGADPVVHEGPALSDRSFVVDPADCIHQFVGEANFADLYSFLFRPAHLVSHLGPDLSFVPVIERGDRQDRQVIDLERIWVFETFDAGLLKECKQVEISELEFLKDL
jgi:hypothetical protein